MAGNKITIQMQGRPEDDGHVKLGAFLSELRAVQDALMKTSGVLASNPGGVELRIVALSHNSPALVQLEIVAQEAQAVAAKFLDAVRNVQEHNQVPTYFDYTMAKAFQKIGEQFGRDLHTLQIWNGDAQRITIDGGFQAVLSNYVVKHAPRARTSLGSVKGRMERANVHNVRECVIWPSIGATRVTCRFGEELKQDVIAAFGHKVRAHGKLKYKPGERFASEMVIHRISQLPEDSQLPKMSEGFGSIPDLAVNQRSEDYVREGRDSEW